MTTELAVPSLPEPGQVVEVRGSTWAVANVQAQGLPRSPADEATARLSHVVDLQSLDEDRLGEQLTVVWELEVGQTITPPQGLPDHIYAEAFDAPATLAGFIDAMRWGAVTSADPNRYQAPFWSGVNIEAYQLEPLRRALTAPRANLLLADDVGLGKTIEAGLVVQELLLRHRARTVIIVCPPSLSLKWQDEMRDKFGLDFTIVNSELLAQVRRTHGLHANPLQMFPRVIVSMAWLPQARAQRMLRDVYAQTAGPKSGKRFAFDILIVDEAHHVAPSSPPAVAGGRAYAIDTQRTVAVRHLADRCEHRLFLSATPHNGHPESFTALMEMIDPRRFSRGALLDSAALKDVTVRRLKRDLTGKGFKTRTVDALTFVPAPDEQEMFALLDEIVATSARLNGTKPSGDIVTMLLTESVSIVGSEKDFYCLIDDDRVHLVGKNGPITSAECFDKWGVPPSQMTEFLAMVGDDADNIEGCPNCGPGRAAKLLQRFGTLAEVKAAVSDGRLVQGVLRGIGELTLASLDAWDPTQALELVRMNEHLPISLVQLLGD